MTKVRIELDIDLSDHATDWIEELEDIVADSLYGKGYRGSLTCENTGNKTQLRKIRWLHR